MRHKLQVHKIFICGQSIIFAICLLSWCTGEPDENPATRFFSLNNLNTLQIGNITKNYCDHLCGQPKFAFTIIKIHCQLKCPNSVLGSGGIVTTTVSNDPNESTTTSRTTTSNAPSTASTTTTTTSTSTSTTSTTPRTTTAAS